MFESAAKPEKLETQLENNMLKPARIQKIIITAKRKTPEIFRKLGKRGMLASLSQSNFVDKNVGLLHLINNKKLVSLTVNVQGTLCSGYQVQSTGIIFFFA